MFRGGPVDLILMPAYAVPAVRHKATINMPFAGTYALLSPILGYPAGVVPVTRVRADEESGRKEIHRCRGENRIRNGSRKRRAADRRAAYGAGLGATMSCWRRCG
jgi:hypothetical protein